VVCHREEEEEGAVGARNSGAVTGGGRVLTGSKGLSGWGNVTGGGGH